MAYAIHRGYPTLLEKCFQEGSVFDPSTDENTAIVMACKKGNPDSVRILLKYPNVDPFVDKGVGLENAIKMGHFEVVKILLAHPSYKSLEKRMSKVINNALVLACQSGEKIVEKATPTEHFRT
jgi:hypothetical protein